jgi:hypothetical protein
MSELGALYRELIAIGTQILQSSDTRAILQEVAQAFVRYSRFERVGVSLYARAGPARSARSPAHRGVYHRGPLARRRAALAQRRASGQILSDKQILEAGHPIGPALYVSAERLPQLRTVAVAQAHPSADWGRMICSIGI